MINEPALPPITSINLYPFSRRRSKYPDQTQEALSTLSSWPVYYLELSSSSVLQPPPLAAAPALEKRKLSYLQGMAGTVKGVEVGLRLVEEVEGEADVSTAL